MTIKTTLSDGKKKTNTIPGKSKVYKKKSRKKFTAQQCNLCSWDDGRGRLMDGGLLCTFYCLYIIAWNKSLSLSFSLTPFRLMLILRPSLIKERITETRTKHRQWKQLKTFPWTRKQAGEEMFLSSPVKASTAMWIFNLSCHSPRSPLVESVDMYYVKEPEFLMLYFVK